jgi:methyl-accepting chemotaxis protein
VGVGERPETLENEPVPSGRGNGTGSDSANGGRRPKKGATRRRGAAASADVEVPLPGTPTRDRRASRERSLHRLLAGLRAVNAGDFSVRLTPNGDPLLAEIIDVFNSVTQKQAHLVDELSRVSVSVGREGKMQDRVSMAGVGGQWMTSIDSVNSLITDLAQPTTEVSRVIKAVAEGDLTRKITVEYHGQILQVK